MTELYIDGTAAYLPKDLSVQVKRENPLFTKNGEYTYDITLPLSAPVNAALYSHLNRLNSVAEVKTRRRAVLVADNRVYCNGTEVVTGWTHDTVTIQIASGNSELNYVIGGNLQVSFLDMKDSGTEADTARILNRYPAIDYCLAPVLNRTSGHFVNLWKTYRHYDAATGQTDDQFLPDSPYFAPQPFLLAYIAELMNALGYELLENQLEGTFLQDLYICHVQETGKWNEMLPGWNVQEFMEQIEKLFNATFVIDNRKRTARLILNSRYYTGADNITAHLARVEDTYEAEVDDEPEQDDHAQSNIHYNLPDNAYWCMACLPDNLRDSARREDIPADFEPAGTEVGRINLWFDDSGNRRHDTIYHDVLYGGDYVHRANGFYALVDQFRGLEREDAQADIELDIVPVETAECTVHATSDNIEGGINSVERTLFLPVIDGNESPDEDTGEDTGGEDEETLYEQIANSTAADGEDDEPSKGRIFLAFFHALEVPVIFGREYPQAGTYPVPFTDRLIEDKNVFNLPQYNQSNDEGATLRLSALDQLLYQAAYDIDFRHAIKVNSHDPNLYSANLIFEIRNRLYVCKEMEFTLDASGRKGAWTSTFYPIRIDPAAVDPRWIVADGRWRDKGVWLDNGRWLDE